MDAWAHQSSCKQERGPVVTPREIYSLLDFSWSRRLPIILQAEASECGLACLAMISGYHGNHTDLVSLRSVGATSSRGTTLTNLMAMAEWLGLQSRPLRLELEELQSLAKPCVLHWGLDHFVVLESVGSNTARIVDPSVGRRRIRLDQVSKKFTGVALELLPAPSFRADDRRKRLSVGRMVSGVRGLAAALWRIMGLAIVIELIASLMPLLTQVITDRVIPYYDHDLLTLLAFGFAGLIVVQVAVASLRSWAIACLSANLNLAWNSAVFGHLLRLPDRYFQDRNLGDIVSRFGSLGDLQESLTTNLVEAILDGLVAVITLALLFLYSTLLAGLTVLSLAVYIMLRFLAFSRFREAQHEQILSDAQRDGLVLELLRGARTVRLMNSAAMMSSRYTNCSAESVNRAFVTQRLMLIFGSASTLIGGTHRIAMIWLGTGAVISGDMTVGMLMATMAYSTQFMSRGSTLVDYLVELRMLGLHADRLSDIVLTCAETNVIGKVRVTAEDVGISIRNVTFRYSEFDEPVLRNVSFDIAPGETVAIVGASGCGKTTLVKIILGLLDPDEGHVLVAGVKLKDLGKGQFRDMVGSVMQDEDLFSGSVSDNICFFSDKRQSDIERAASIAQIHAEIMLMPMGYETHMGGIGSSISGGQKQRILLARALYRRPRVLILDEATSHLDVENERLVNATVRGQRMTRLIIAHRPETIAIADRVILLRSGVVEESDMLTA